MNYHFMIDEKFVDGFIADSERVSAGKNVYVFTFAEPPEYVRSKRGIFAPYSSDVFENLKREIHKGDRVFIHWLHDDAARFISTLPSEVEVGAFFWGGDFVDDPFYFHKEKLLGPRSLKLYNSKFEYPLFVTKNPFSLLQRVRFRCFQFKDEQNRRRDLKQAAVQRLDYLFHWNPLDHKVVERLYGAKIESRFFFYDVGLDEEISALENPYIVRNRPTRIWLGNSSSISNNHLEAIDFLSRYKEEDLEIFCPLSYGEQKYGDVIQKAGERAIGSKFIALREFLERKAYYDLMDRVDVVVMNHQRTQAAGNIWAFLKMGKKIYMNRESTLYQLLKSAGVEVFPLSNTGVEFAEFVEPLARDVATANYELFQELFSVKRKRETLEGL